MLALTEVVCPEMPGDEQSLQVRLWLLVMYVLPSGVGVTAEEKQDRGLNSTEHTSGV